MPPRSLPLWKSLLLGLLAFSPAFFTANLVWQKAVDVGCWDMWENGPLLKKWHDGIHWADLYAAQIQHRIVIPRLIIIALTHLSAGDFRWEQYFTFFLILLNSALVALLLKRTAGDSLWRWPVLFAINLLLFSPIHYQILFWGSSMWSVLPMPCVLGCLLLGTAQATVENPEPGVAGPSPAVLPKAAWYKFAIAVLLAEVATHSFGHGLALWPALLPFLLFSPSWGPIRQRCLMIGIWLLIAAITIKCYFTDFKNVAFHAYNLNPGDDAMKGSPDLSQWKNVQAAIQFFWSFLGSWFSRSPFSDRPLTAAHTLGIWTLSIWLVVCAAIVVWPAWRRRWRAVLPWVVLGIYVVGVGLMISKRGSDIGEHRAITPRYLAISEYLWISLLGLGVALSSRKTSSTTAPSSVATSRRTLPIVASVLLSAFVMAQIPVWQFGLYLTDVWYRARLQAQALLLFLPSFESHPKLISMKALDKQYKYCLDSVRELRSQGLLKTQPLDSPELKAFSTNHQPFSDDKADVTSAVVREDGTIELNGHARFSVGQPADAVLLVQDGRVIGLGQPTPKPLLRIYALDFEFSNYEEVPVPSMYPWKGLLAPDAIPNPAAPVELWALDVARREVTQLQCTLKVDAANKSVQVQR